MSATAGALVAIGSAPLDAQSPPVTGPALKPSSRPGGEPMEEKAVQADRGFVIAAGMTEAEADCWETIAKAAGQFFDLPALHPMDAQEVASAIHIVQNKLLSRVTYRRYLEMARAAGEAQKARPKD
jgi:hypothetical protein